MTKITRRDALATGFGLAAFGTVLSDLGYAEETATKDAVWRFAPVDVNLVGKLVYENYDAGGCLYGAFKGAVLAYATAVESVDAEAARVARSCPFVAFRCARGGFGRLKELCGAVAGGVSGAIDGGDAKESKPKETRTEYLIGAPERPDRDETIYSTDDPAEANETLREILAALAAADATPALWKNGRKTDAESFRFD